MSDTDTGATVAAPPVSDAPAPEPAAPVAVPETQAPERPRNKREARQMAIQAGKELSERSTHHSIDQAREPAGTAEGGQFSAPEPPAAEEQPQEQPEAVEAPVLSDLTAVDDTPVEVAPSTEEVAAPAPTTGTVTIPLPEGHPWRDRGHTELTDIPEALEQEIRAGVNAAMQNRELRAAQERNALLEARMKAMEGDLPAQFEKDPKLARLLEDIGDTYDAETAELVKAGFVALQQDKVRQVESETLQEVQQRQYVQSVRDAVFLQAPKELPLWGASPPELHHQLMTLLPQYGDLVDARNRMYAQQGKRLTAPTAQEFFSWVKSNAYGKDPRVVAKNQAATKAEQVKREEQIRKQAMAERDKAEQERLKDAAARHGARPPTTPVQTTRGSAIPAEAEDAKSRHEAMRSPNRKRAIRQQILEDFAGR